MGREVARAALAESVFRLDLSRAATKIRLSIQTGDSKIEGNPDGP